MKVKLLFFTKVFTKINIYERKNKDLFLFLLVEVLSNKKIKENTYVLEELEKLFIPKEMFYLFNNAFFTLVDNNLLITEEKSIYDLRFKDFKLNNLLDDNKNKNYYFALKEIREKEFSYDPIDKEITIENKYNNQENVAIINYLLPLEIVNQKLNNDPSFLFIDLEKTNYLESKILEKDPFLKEIQLEKRKNELFLPPNIEENIKESFFNNLVKGSGDVETPKGEVLFKNKKVEMAIGDERILDIEAKYYFLTKKTEKKHSLNVYLLEDSNLKGNIYYHNNNFKKIELATIKIEGFKALCISEKGLNRKEEKDIQTQVLKKAREKNLDKLIYLIKGEK